MAQIPVRVSGAAEPCMAQRTNMAALPRREQIAGGGNVTFDNGKGFRKVFGTSSLGQTIRKVENANQNVLDEADLPATRQPNPQVLVFGDVTSRVEQSCSDNGLAPGEDA